MGSSRIRFLVVAALAALALAACSSSGKTAGSSPYPPAHAGTTVTAIGAGTTTAASTGAETVSLASSDLGRVLVDPGGLTLYLDENDKPGQPACTAGCLAVWPPLEAPAAATFGAGLDASMFSTVTASDGTKQLAVNGFPLYTFVGKPAGDVSGQGVNGFYVVGADGKKIEDEGS
jgi:predicted lipoprotein with Yx(FWY)xxD motif